MSKHYKDTVGTEILVDVKEELTDAAKVILKVIKPSGVAVDWVGTKKEFTKISYIVGSGDWNEAGDYKLQAYVEMPGWSGLGETATFHIYDHFK